MSDLRPKTIFLDIDGCLLKHNGDITRQHLGIGTCLDGVHEALTQWDRKGYKIILCSGRRESTRKDTERQLSNLGIFYDVLLLGVTGGIRVLINDTKPDKTESTTQAITLQRNEGLSSVADL